MTLDCHKQSEPLPVLGRDSEMWFRCLPRMHGLVLHLYVCMYVYDSQLLFQHPRTWSWHSATMNQQTNHNIHTYMYSGKSCVSQPQRKSGKWLLLSQQMFSTRFSTQMHHFAIPASRKQSVSLNSDSESIHVHHVFCWPSCSIFFLIVLQTSWLRVLVHIHCI